ncbi:YqiA/YcfP family alpha/beta fold hydrolase [Fastidiosibacter lacustris]|uniref:YqiA/YcfP family alpha/beta fold hydrolase n=1 Tax=Fastidiosibacter lacustris TaxID=2056695 RepID=UPI000E344C57|nr:YqiA/YcfP family alpha/beta fold hydrolase [Fastidiosibacter lacustris]
MSKLSKYFLYLHGFQGSPTSPKAQKLKQWFKQKYPNAQIDMPHLTMNTQQAMSMIDRLLSQAKADSKVIIGSSLGGYMAHLLKQTRSDIDKVILINPASRLDLIALMPQYSDMYHEAMALVNAMPKQLKHMNDYLLLLQQDDTITPAHLAEQVFACAHIDIKTGQGHSYSNIDVSFELIEEFLTQPSALFHKLV